MSVPGFIPWMKPRHTKRNIGVGVLLFFLIPIGIAVAPFYLLYAVGRDKHDLETRLMNSRLSGLPGIKRGGWAAGVSVCCYSLLAMVLFVSIFGGADDGATDVPEAETEGGEMNEAGVNSDDSNNEQSDSEAESESSENSQEESDSGDGSDGEQQSQTGIEQVVDDEYDVTGGQPELSPSGDLVLFGLGDGRIAKYDADRDSEMIPTETGTAVSHIEISDNGETAAVGWMDSEMLSQIDMAENDGPLYQHPWMWDLDMTSDGETIASVSFPDTGTGGLVVVTEDGLEWEAEFEESSGQTVAIADDGESVAVGAGHYWEAGETVGTPGVKFYTGDGEEQWTHETESDIVSIDINAEQERIVAGTNDGRTIVLNFEGEVVRETSERGGWVFLSDDGSTIVHPGADGVVRAVDTETGEVNWTADVGYWPSEYVDVSENGSRVIVSDTGGGEVAVIDSGEVIWKDSHDVGPAFVALSDDGSTWGVAIQNNDDFTTQVEVYEDHDYDTEE